MQFQHGQAMVEYAILFIVLSILFIGGAELGMAALASYKNTDAAKTGISEYAEVNQRRLNILNAEKQYSLALRSSLTSESCTNIVGKGNNDDGLSTDSDQFKCSVDSEYQLIFSDYIDFLDAIDNVIGLTEYALTTNLLSNYDDKLIEFDDEEPDVSLSDNELLLAEQSLSSPPVFDSADTNEEKQKKISERLLKLLLIQHIKLSRLPLEIGEKLSQSKIAIGDHSSNLIQQPNCNGGIYDDGLPSDRYIYREYYDNIEPDKKHIFQTGSVVYLFNPLPINTASCQTITGGLAKLVAGYTPHQSVITSAEDFENNFVAGLPKLNQAMYGMYKNDLNGNLIPPGKMCVSDDTNICPDQDLISDEIGPTGYFRWNKGSDSTEAFKYTINDVNSDLQNFRPSMQIECNTSPTPDLSTISSCNTAFSKVRLHTRYRKIFEGFLGFGVRAIDVSNDEDYEAAVSLFYNPNNGSLNGQVNGVIDSEIGPLGNNGRLSVKQFKDFRGCYEVDVETNQISSCN